MPKIPGYIRRACTSRETSVEVNKSGVEYTTTRNVIDTTCVSNMMAQHTK